MGLFVVVALFGQGVRSVIDANRGQFHAILTQLLPTLFDQRLVFTPRAPFVAAFVVALLIVSWVTFGACCAATLHLFESAGETQRTSVRRAVRDGVASSGRVAGYLLAVAVLTTVGTLAFVVPGVYIAIRSFVGLPALVRDGRSIRGSLRESWTRTAGAAVAIGVLLLALLLVAALLSRVPVVGALLAFVTVCPLTVGASLVAYDALDETA